MIQPKPLYHWTVQIKSMFPNLSKPQAEVLAAFSFGIAKAESRPLNIVERALTRKKPPRQAQGDGRIRRIRGAGDPGGDDDAPSDSVADGTGRDDSDDAQTGSERSGRGAET